MLLVREVARVVGRVRGVADLLGAFVPDEARHLHGHCLPEAPAAPVWQIEGQLWSVCEKKSRTSPKGGGPSARREGDNGSTVIGLRCQTESVLDPKKAR